MDDAALLSAYARAGDADAFGEFVRRHTDLVYSAALRQAGGRHHDAEEMTHQVFLVVTRRAAALARHPCLVAWLHRAVHNVARDHRRSERRRQTLATRATPELALAAAETAAPADADWRSVSSLLDATLDSLPERDREVILLRYFAQKTFTDIGRSLNLAENAARMRTDRALEKLRRALARRGVTSTAGALALALGQHAVIAAPAGVAARSASFALGASASVVTFTASLAALASYKFAAALTVLACAATLATWAWWPRAPFTTGEPRADRASASPVLAIAATAAHDASSIAPLRSPTPKADPAYGYMEERYRAFIDPLGLAPEARDRLIRGLVRRELDTRQARELGLRHGINIDDPAEMTVWFNELAGPGALEIRAVLTTEDFQRILAYERRLTFTESYADFIAESGMDPATAERFIDAALKSQIDPYTARKLGLEHQINVDDPAEFAAWREALARPGFEALREILGADGAARFIAYERDPGASLVRNAAPLFASAGLPLTPEQRAQLAAATRRAPAPPKRPSRDAERDLWVGYQRASAERYAALENEFSPILAPEQRAILSDQFASKLREIDLIIAKQPPAPSH